MANAYEDLLNELNRKQEELTQKQKEAEQQRLEGEVAQIEAGKADVEKQHKQSAREAYISYMQGRKVLPDQLATRGIVGGAAENSQLQQRLGYERNLGTLNAAKNTALADIDKQITGARLQSAQNQSNIELQAGRNLLDRTGSLGRAAIAQDYQTERDRIADERYANEWAYQQEQDAYNRQMYEDEQRYAREQQEDENQRQAALDAYSRAMDRWQLTGILDAEGAKVLGVPEGTLTSSRYFNEAELALEAFANQQTEKAVTPLDDYVVGTHNWFSALDQALGANAARAYISHTLKDNELLSAYDDWKKGITGGRVGNSTALTVQENYWADVLLENTAAAAAAFDEHPEAKTAANIATAASKLRALGMPEKYVKEFKEYFGFE